MFKVRGPFFQVDDGGDWFAEPVETSVDDDQPVVESETETLEDDEQETVENEAEVNTDEADRTEDDPETDDEPSEDEEVDMGDGREPVKLSELKQGYLRQSDYTKKTQALADERKTFETEREQMSPIKQMSDFLGANPYLREQVQNFIREFTQTGYIPIQEALADAQFGQYINTLMMQNEALQRELYDVRGKYGELEFTGTMKDLTSQLKAEYGELATAEYLKSLEERAKNEKLSPTVLKEIADAHLAKQKLEQVSNNSKKIKKETEKQTYQKMREKGDLPSNPRKSGQVPQSGKQLDPHEPIGWDDVFS